MINYIQLAENELDARLKMRGTPYEGLLQVYALLVFVVGERCTKRNIHDAWSSWQNLTQPEHRSLLPFDQLTKEVQRLDETYRLAVILENNGSAAGKFSDEIDLAQFPAQ